MTSEQVSAPFEALNRQGPHPDPWIQAEALLLQAIMMKDMFGRIDPSMAKAADDTIHDFLDDICPPYIPRKIPRRFPPPPPPDPFRVAAGLASIAEVIGGQSLRMEILKTAERLFSRAVELSLTEQKSG